MSMGPIGGIVGSVAGSPLSQTKGATTERAATDAAAQERAVELDLKAQKSSGVGQTEGDQQASDRDADGRRLWELPPEAERDGDAEEPASDARQDDESGGAGLDLIA